MRDANTVWEDGKGERSGNQRKLEGLYATEWGGGWLGHVGNPTGQADSPHAKAHESGVRCQILCKMEMNHWTDVQGKIGPAGSASMYTAQRLLPNPTTICLFSGGGGKQRVRLKQWI